MAVDPAKWKAVIEFTGVVMDRKEIEREEQAEARHSGLIRETRELLEELDRGTRWGTGQSSTRSSITQSR